MWRSHLIVHAAAGGIVICIVMLAQLIGARYGARFSPTPNADGKRTERTFADAAKSK